MSNEDTTPRAGGVIDRDELGLSLAEHWARRGIVEQHDDVPGGCDEFPDDEDIVFRAYQSAVDFVLDRLAAAGLLVVPGCGDGDKPPTAEQPGPPVEMVTIPKAHLDQMKADLDRWQPRAEVPGDKPPADTPRTWSTGDPHPAGVTAIVDRDDVTWRYEDDNDGFGHHAWNRRKVTQAPGARFCSVGPIGYDWADLLDEYGPVREATAEEWANVTIALAAEVPAAVAADQPADYVDKNGDVWRSTPSRRLRLIEHRGEAVTVNRGAFDFDVIEEAYGPLVARGCRGR